MSTNNMTDLILFYDTETTGLPLWHEPSDDPRQPHLVQLAAALVDTETRQTVQSMDVIIRPEGWEIPDDVAKIHGITTERAQAIGVPEDLALNMLLSLWESGATPRLRAGHNESFDARIIRIACKRYHDDEIADYWKSGPAECTARMAAPIVNLPPTERMLATGRNHAKTPNLGECVQHFFGETLEDAHSAMVDVQACMRVYWAAQGDSGCDAVPAA